MQTLLDIFQEAGKYHGGLPMSYSRMETLRRCPLSFVLKYQQKPKLPELSCMGDDVAIGKSAHWVMESSIMQAFRYRNFTLEGTRLSFYLDHVLQGAKNDYQRTVMENLRAPMAEVCSRLLRLMSLEGTVISTEKNIRLNSKGEPMTGRLPFKRYGSRHDIGFTGYIDLEMVRGNSMNLVDYKTEMPSEQRREEVIKQTGLYAYMEFLCNPALETVGTYCIYLKNAHVDKVASYSRVTDLPKLEDKVLSMFRSYVGALRDLKPVATENRYCCYCEYKAAGLCTLRSSYETEKEQHKEGEEVRPLGASASDMVSSDGIRLADITPEDSSGS